VLEILRFVGALAALVVVGLALFILPTIAMLVGGVLYVALLLILPLAFGGSCFWAAFTKHYPQEDSRIMDVFWRGASVILGVLLIVGGYVLVFAILEPIL